MDANGDIFIEPEYDAIGEFKQYGYAVMQREGGVGLLNKLGQEIINPKYDDLKVLDSTLVAVMDERQWMVVNLDEKIILNKGYQRVHVWESKYLAYLQNDKWGLADANDGRIIAEPQFEEVELLDKKYFLTKNELQLGIIAPNGQVILPTSYDEVRVYNDKLFFFRQKNKWGAVNELGEEIIAPLFKSYQKISDEFIKLNLQKSVYLYSSVANAIITSDEYQNFYNFSTNIVLTKKNRQLGLIDARGNPILPNNYNEIHFYADNRYRVNVEGKWGIVATGGEVIMPFQYDYIAPLDDEVCIVKKGDFFGIVNFMGEEVVEPKFTKIELKDNSARAFEGEKLTVLYFDEEGQLKDQSQFKKHMTIRIGKRDPNMVRRNRWGDDGDNFSLENFEWFYSSGQDKWGLRRLEDGSIQIEPTYDWIQIEKQMGFTIVGIEKMSYYNFDRTEYRYEMLFGLVNNEVGMLTTLVNMWDIRMGDFDRGLPVARVLFDNGRHGLVSRIGKIIKKDYAYIGDFHDGLARMSIKGRLSGNIKAGKRGIRSLNQYLDFQMAPNQMVDYTQHDREFNLNAQLTCEKCYWGYIDTLGEVIATPYYDFAHDFVNEVGIVELDEKWGAVSKEAQLLIPCKYDNVDFLENTDKQILRISIDRQKYGLIDSLGQVTVGSTYDMIGDFAENRLAVMLNNKWGFVNKNGIEIIPCIYDKVQNFEEGYATVKKGRKWGIINKNGDTIIDFEYSHLGNVKNDLVWFHDSSGKGYMNIEGKIVISPQYQRVNDFNNGVARVMSDGKWGLIDTKGDFVLRPKFSLIEPFNAYGLAVVRYGADRIRYGIIDQTGKLLTNKAYQKIQEYKEGFAAVLYKGKYGFINTKGDLAIPNIYSKVSDFSQGRVAAQKEGVCGYIDTLGQEICTFEFSKCLDFQEGKAIVYKGLRKAGLMNLEGKLIIEPSINRLIDFKDGRGLVRDNSYRFYYITEQARLYEGYYENASEFQNGVAVVQIDGKWGIINQKGIEIIPPKYDKIEKFEDGYAKVRIGRFSGLTNLKGDLIVEPDYEYISYAGDGLFRVEQGDMVGYFDADGKWVWSLQK